MQLDAQFLDILRCPQSGLKLKLSDGQLETEDGKLSYPLVDGIPWLIAHPRNSLLDWGTKLNHFQQVLLQETAQLAVERDKAKGAVHDRIECLLLAKKDFLLEITKLLQPLTVTKVSATEVYNALLDRAPTTQNLLSYEANIYRDWQWGSEENGLSREMVKRFLPAQVGKLVVLGAGACRLALDVHELAAPDMTVATDINPFFLLAVNKLIHGESFFLTEFPQYPKLTEYVAVKHQMSALSEPPVNFHLGFADVAKPAFASGAFDTVLTPWLIDIQPHECSLFLRQLNQYLPEGGYWLNFGSLVFNQQRESLCYSTDEVVELAAAAGFEIEEMEQQRIPYLKSPYGAGYRMETVWVWRAIKREHVAPVEDVQSMPDWLLDTRKNIPVSSRLTSLLEQNKFLTALLSEINGKCSIRSLSEKFAGRDGSDPDELEQMLVTYFQRLQ